METQPPLSFWQKNKMVSTSFIVTLLVSALIQMQDNALLFGSIGLFILLTLAMYLSRKIDWYGIDRKTAEA
jgi:inner membrane protein